MARKREPRVWGIDPSITSTGIALSDGTTFTVKDKTIEGDRRLAHLYSSVLRGAWLHDFGCIEDMPRNAQSAGVTAQAHGVVKAALVMGGVPFISLPPSVVKKCATGNGAAKKPEMMARMLDVDPRPGEGLDDNQADAWWLRQCGLELLGRTNFLVDRAPLDKYRDHDIVMAMLQSWPRQ